MRTVLKVGAASLVLLVGLAVWALTNPIFGDDAGGRTFRNDAALVVNDLNKIEDLPGLRPDGPAAVDPCSVTDELRLSQRSVGRSWIVLMKDSNHALAPMGNIERRGLQALVMQLTTHGWVVQASTLEPLSVELRQYATASNRPVVMVVQALPGRVFAWMTDVPSSCRFNPALGPLVRFARGS